MIWQSGSRICEEKARPSEDHNRQSSPPRGEGPVIPASAPSPDMNARPVDNPLRVDVLRHGAEGLAPIAVEPGHTEGVRDRRRRVPQQQACLQREGHHLDDAPGDAFEFAGLHQAALELIGERVEALVGAARLVDFIQKDHQTFGLALHRTSREFPVLGLVVAKGGLRMKESPPDPNADAGKGNVDVNASGGASGVSVDFGKGSSYFFGSDKFEGKRMSMALLADSLARYEADPVVDMTGLTAVYDFTLELTPEDYRAMLIRSAIGAGVQLPPEALRMLDGNAGDSLTASLERLGLKLERRKAAMDVMIVDKASKTPTAN